MAQLVLLSGFLGAGKTTTMLAAARRFAEQGERAAVITNDQAADLVDTKLARSALDEVAEIAGGCFCCRFEDLEAAVKQLLDETGVDVILAEAVGSCTDLQATVVRPLRRFYGDTLAVAPVTTVVDPDRLRELAGDESDLGYLFAKQLADGDIIALNKLDLHGEAQLTALGDQLAVAFPGLRTLAYSATTGAGLPELMSSWDQPAGERPDLDVDYDRYAAAEAALAWLNHTVTLSAAEFSPAAWAERALTEISTTCAREGYLIGHAKLSVESPAGLVKLSVTDANRPVQVDLTTSAPAQHATAVLNLRVNCEPDTLDALVRGAVATASKALGVTVAGGSGASFQPGYPRPTHRIPAS